MRLQVVRTSRNLTGHAGLVAVGHCLNHFAQLPAAIDPALPVRSGIATSDVVRVRGAVDDGARAILMRSRTIALIAVRRQASRGVIEPKLPDPYAKHTEGNVLCVVEETT